MTTVWIGVIEWGSQYDDVDIVTVAAETEYLAKYALLDALRSATFLDGHPDLPITGTSFDEWFEAYSGYGPWCTVNQLEVIPVP